MTSDLWTRLSREDKPIILYGMGNGADKILFAFERYGIKAAGVFASDDFVRGQSFHGMKVESYAQVSARLDNFIVVVAFATRLDHVIQNIFRIAAERELYVPDVPVSGGELFTAQFAHDNRAKLERARALLADEASRMLFDSVIEYRLCGELPPLFEHTSERNEVFGNLLCPGKYTSCVDAGAYTGDTLRELEAYAPGLQSALALEPDAKNYARLAVYCASRPGFRAVNAGAWDRAETLAFNEGAGRGSSAGRGGARVTMTTIDALLGGSGTDYIKYDVEGAEEKALLGSAETIARFSPDLCVSLYHKSADIFELVLLVSRLNPSYRLYLRRFCAVPAWELNLYAIGA